MIIIAEVSELTRKIKLPTDRVLSVNGDYQVDGIAFKLPGTYEGDFDFSTAAARVHWTGVDKVEHTNLITEEDGNGYPLWVMPSELTQGGHGIIEFAISFVATDETAAVTKRWISDPVSFRNRRTVNGSNEDEEAEEETIYDRLASAVASVRAAQAEVEDTNAVLSSLTGSAPVPVENRSDMVDNGHLYLYTGDETGFVTGNLYYYVSGTLTNGGPYGAVTLDDTLSQSGQAADAAAVGEALEDIGDDIADIKEDLDDVNERLEEVEDELGIIPPDTYRGTIEQANTYTRIAENLSFDLATGYKFTFKISAPLNTDVYFNVMRSEGNQLFSKTISPGGTSAERVYTTSASVPVTAGYILARANATNVSVEIEIEPEAGTSSRIDTLETNVQSLERYPYTTLPDYVLGGAWYKPLGSLSKGYFCMVADDGRIGMNEYTIPTLVIGKGVKCTFAIMSASEVMADAEKIAVVKDAVDNYGCSVAQHGGNRWTSFNEYQLNEFFDTEKAFFDGIGIEVRGAVIPEHYNSKLIYAVAGGKYGVVRSGYDGHIYPTVCPYADYSNGPRSNLYGLTSYNIVDKTLASNKAAVDSAIANHRLMIVYIHENSLDAAKKAVIEGLMDYVIETGITQVTLGDIPNLI